MTWPWQGPTPLDEVADEIEAMADDEVIVFAIPFGLPATERVRKLDDVQALVDELRRRGHVPTVQTRRVPAGEMYGVTIDRGGGR